MQNKEWEYDKKYNLADEEEWELYLNRIDGIMTRMEKRHEVRP